MQQRQMQERTDPKFFQFKNEGDSISGTFIFRERKNFENAPGWQYTVRDDSGELYCFNGALEIDKRLFPDDLNKYITVRFEHVEHLQGNKTLKHFRVFVEQKSAADEGPDAWGHGRE